jgi:hypothetical protein
MKETAARLLGVGLAAMLAAGPALASAPRARAAAHPASGRHRPASRPAGLPDLDWGAAHAVPGLAALAPDVAAVTSVSCSAPGECAAGGWSVTMSPPQQRAFVVSEVSGTWGLARPVAVPASLNAGSWAAVSALSCASPGNCAAGGYYGDQPGSDGGDGATAAFVVTEVNGQWGTAQPVGGQPTGADDNTAIVAVSCSRPGDCLAGGNTVGAPYAGAMTGFTVRERAGAWGSLTPIAGASRSSTLTAVSCAKPGSCAIGGSMGDGQQAPARAFVATEDGDRWHQARLVAGVPDASALGSQVTAVDCPAAGACTAAGYYATSQQAPDGNQASQVFAVNQVRFTWRAGIEIPGSEQANRYHEANVAAISCAAPGNCVVGGQLTTGADGATRGFVSAEARDSWQHQPLIPLAGTASYVAALDCPATGWCAVADEVLAGAGDGPQPYLMQEQDGTWAPPSPLGGLPLPDGWSDDVNALSCAAPGYCSLGGDAAYMPPSPSRYPGAMLADQGQL